MGTEVTTALIAFVGATCASLIAIGGVMIGLASSYLLQALQRKWALDDQRREWKRRELEEHSESFIELSDVIHKVYITREVTQDTNNVVDDFLGRNLSKPPPIDDVTLKKLGGLFTRTAADFIEFVQFGDGEKDNYSKLHDKFLFVARRLQERINTLIEETYK
jgi:hypothetical protein